MSGGIVARYAGTLLLLFLFINEIFPQTNDQSSVRLMFYNVENLFDTFNDTLTDDDEFLPSGLRRWNQARYYSKINSISKVIIAAGEWHIPAIIGLCEIENRKVLEDIVYGTNLSRYDFGIIHEESNDPRGIDVALIYRKDIVNVITYKYLLPEDFSERGFTSRSVLYLKSSIMGDTIHLFVNHWPSRRGGVLAGEEQRLLIARMLNQKADSLMMTTKGRARIILAGDFNSTPDDIALNMLMKIKSSEGSLINLASDVRSGHGTYRYMGTWEMIDQVLVSDFLLRTTEGIYSRQDLFRIFDPSFLLKADPKYPGPAPFSTYRGFRYQGGFSDHLPILLDLKVRMKD